MPPKRKTLSASKPVDVTEPRAKAARVGSAGNDKTAAATRPNRKPESASVIQDEFVYQVYRSYDETTSWDSASTNVETDVYCEEFSSLEEANYYAKRYYVYLDSDWEVDGPEPIEIHTDENGLVTVNARWPKGETGTMEVRKVKVDPATANKKVKGSLNSSVKLHTSPRPNEERERTPVRRDKLLYQVLRSSDDAISGGNVEETVPCGTFSDLQEANEFAKELLLKEWDRDCFESYDISTNAEGLVTVDAVWEEGETGTVEVRKVKPTAKPLNGSSNVWILLEKKRDSGDWGVGSVLQSKAGAMMALENRAAELDEAEKATGVKYRMVGNGSDRPDSVYAKRIAANGEYETVLRIEKWRVQN